MRRKLQILYYRRPISSLLISNPAYLMIFKRTTIILHVAYVRVSKKNIVRDFVKVIYSLKYMFAVLDYLFKCNAHRGSDAGLTIPGSLYYFLQTAG